MSAESAHLSTFGAETETEIRSTSNVDGQKYRLRIKALVVWIRSNQTMSAGYYKTLLVFLFFFQRLISEVARSIVTRF